MSTMECHWKDVREECRFDLCAEATRDHGKLAKGSKIIRTGSVQLWAGKHLRDEDGELVCLYRTRPRWGRNLAAGSRSDILDPRKKCGNCGRVLTRVLNEDEWIGYKRWRTKRARYSYNAAQREAGYKAWWETGRHRTGPGGKKGRFWDRKHRWEGDRLVCLYTTSPKRHRREYWASLARTQDKITCGQCGRPVSLQVKARVSA